MMTPLRCVIVVGLMLLVGCQDARITELRSSDPARRADACHRIAADPDVPQKVIQALRQCVQDDSPQVRRLAIEALGQIGTDADDDVLMDLQQAIGDADESVRLAAALAALQFDPQLPEAQEPVLAGIRARNPQLILAVGELGPAASWATPAVRELLSDRESQIRELAEATMARIQRPVP